MSIREICLKRFVCFVLSMYFLIFPILSYTVPNDTVVYIAPHGEKYHREGCSYISSDAKSLLITVAVVRGYSPCSRCDPDQHTGEYIAPKDVKRYRDITITPSVSVGESGDDGASAGDTGISNHRSAFSTSHFWGVVLSAGAVFLGAKLLRKHRLGRQRLQEAKLQYEQERARLSELYGDKTKTDIAVTCGMPDVFLIGTDGLPCQFVPYDWGEAFTFYTARGGVLYHAHPNCHPAATFPQHALFVTGRRPCPRCNPQLPDLSWHKEYREIMQVIRYYKVDILPEPYREVCYTMLMRSEREKDNAQNIEQ